MMTDKQFPRSLKKGKLRDGKGKQTKITSDIPDGIIAHLTRKCGRNVHDHHIVVMTLGSFEKETEGLDDDDPRWAARNAADLETDLFFCSVYRSDKKDIPHTRNNWLCYDFKERRIVPTHYTIRTHAGYGGPGGHHLKLLVETSVDGESWREVAREEDNKQLNGARFIGTFAVANGRECDFIRLVRIGRNHAENDMLLISGWQIFGSLIAGTADFSNVTFVLRSRAGRGPCRLLTCGVHSAD
jgi:hypothetical protein